MTASVPIRWEAGVFVLAAKDAFDQTVDEAHAEEIFLTLLRSFAGSQRYVSDKPSSSYAPKLFADQPAASKLTKRELELAMNRLFETKRIPVALEGPPSRQIRQIKEASDAPFIPSSDPVHTPSDRLSTHTPYNPHPGVKGKEGSEAPPPHTGGEREESAEPEVDLVAMGFKPTGDCGVYERRLPPGAKVKGMAPGQRCHGCGKGMDVFLIRRRRHKGEAFDPRHVECANKAWAAKEPPP
jgi:hypothetical protein